MRDGDTVIEHSFGLHWLEDMKLRLEARSSAFGERRKTDVLLRFDYGVGAGLTAHVDIKLAESPEQMRQLASWLLEMADMVTPGTLMDEPFPSYSVAESENHWHGQYLKLRKRADKVEED